MYTEQDLTNLIARVQQLEQQIAHGTAGQPATGLNSKNFLTRAFSVWGLNFVASLLISIAVSCLFTILGLILGAGFLGAITEWLSNFGGNIPVP